MSETRPGPALVPVDGALSRRERIQLLRHRLQLAAVHVAGYTATHKNARMLLLQCLGALAVLVGISFFSIPCALIVGGIAAIAAAERQ